MWGQRRGGAAAQLRHGSWALQIGCKTSCCCCSELGLLGGRLLLAAALLPAVGQRVVHISVPAGQKVVGELGSVCGNTQRWLLAPLNSCWAAHVKRLYDCKCKSETELPQKPRSLTGPRCG